MNVSERFLKASGICLGHHHAFLHYLDPALCHLPLEEACLNDLSCSSCLFLVVMEIHYRLEDVEVEGSWNLIQATEIVDEEASDA